MVDCARHGRSAPWHAWGLLITGACATVAANVAAGLSHGLVGAVIAGWPALVACGCFDLLLRHRRHRTPTTTAAHAADGMPASSPVPLSTAPTVAGTDPPADPAIQRARELYAAGWPPASCHPSAPSSATCTSAPTALASSRPRSGQHRPARSSRPREPNAFPHPGHHPRAIGVPSAC